MMTHEQIAAMRADADAGTPGPWIDPASAMAALKGQRDPETAKVLFQLSSARYPSFIDDWHKTSIAAQEIVDDLFDVMNWLREDNHFAQADRVRTLMARLAKSVHPHPRFSGWGDPDLIRNVARTYPDQLSIKESKAVIAERDASKATIVAQAAEIERLKIIIDKHN